MTTPTSNNSFFSYRFIIVVVFFVTCLITANIIIVKQISIGPVVLPAGIVVFPISYIFGDILTEVYGYQRARQVIWLGFICNLFAVFVIWIAQILPPAPVFDGQSAYERILGNTPRYLAASFMGYLAGEFTNSMVMARMKILTHGRWLWMRTIGSTIAGQGLDTFIALLIAFSGVLPFSFIMVMGLSHWIAKIIYEAIITPLTYVAVGYLKRVERMDVYDYQTDFNPLRITR